MLEFIDNVIGPYIVYPIMCIVIPLFFPLLGCIMTYIQMKTLLTEKYGSILVTKEILRTQSFRDRLFLNVPRHHIEQRWEEYKRIQVCSRIFRADCLITSLIVFLGREEFLALPCERMNLTLMIICGIKAALLEILVLAYIIFCIEANIGDKAADIYITLINAENDVDYAHKKLDRLYRKVMTPKRQRKEAEYLKMIKNAEEQIQKIHEENQFDVYDGNPYD